MPFPSGENTGLACDDTFSGFTGFNSPEPNSIVQSDPANPAAAGSSVVKTTFRPSGLQLGSACCPRGLPGVVICRNCEPSAPTAQIVESPWPGQSNDANEFGSLERNTSGAPSGDHAGQDP